MHALMRFQLTYWNLPKFFFLFIGWLTTGSAFILIILTANGDAEQNMAITYFLLNLVFTAMVTKDTFQWALQNGVARQTFGQAMLLWQLAIALFSAALVMIPLLILLPRLGVSDISLIALFGTLFAWFLWQHSLSMSLDILFSRTVNLPVIAQIAIGLVLVFLAFLAADQAVFKTLGNRLFTDTLLGQHTAENMVIFAGVYLAASLFNLVFIKNHRGYSDRKELAKS